MRNRLRIFSLATVVCFFLGQGAYAATYTAKCLNEKGKFSGCNVTVDENSVALDYKMKSQQSMNVDIPGRTIKSLTAGEYARRRVAESVAAAIILSPVFLFALFSKKKMDHIGIEYQTDNGTSKATLVTIKKKYGMALKQELKAVSGKEIKEEIQQTKPK